MSSGLGEQRNRYKGSPPRSWLRLQFPGSPQGTHEVDLVADTGNPCALIISEANMTRVKQRNAVSVNSNFGPLKGGWIRIHIPEVALDQDVLAYASDVVVAATKASSSDFEGLAGLPLLRLLAYGGDGDCFWVRPAPIRT
jgi:hypothetical protein